MAPPQFINPYWATVVPPYALCAHPLTFQPPRSPSSSSSAGDEIVTPPSSPPPMSSVASTPTTDGDKPRTPLPNIQAGVAERANLAQMQYLLKKIRARSPNAAGKTLDKFAPTYVPAWYKNLAAPGIRRLIPPSAPFPPTEYLEKEVSSAFTQAPLRLTLDAIAPSLLALPPPPTTLKPLSTVKKGSIVPPNLGYIGHFSALLAQSFEAQVNEYKEAKLWSVPLEPEALGDNLFTISVPSIREDSPKLHLGDRLTLRVLRPDLQLAANSINEAEVVGYNKLKGIVYIKSPYLAVDLRAQQRDQNGELHYQVEFRCSSDPVCAMQDAVRAMGSSLDREEASSRRWLFPTLEDRAPVKVPKVLRFHDDKLNDIQKSAIEGILAPNRKIPYLISGPPGTGKTKTLAEAVVQIIERDDMAFVLLCAPSNPAADTLARRLRSSFGPDVMFRLNSNKRTFAEVPQTLLPYCHVVDDAFALPDFKKMLSYRIVVTTCVDAEILVNARLTNLDLLALQTGIKRPFEPTRKHWTHLLIDEAAQASEPETLVPLLNMLSVNGQGGPDPTIVLCGDTHQLGPVISSRQARDGELDVSLLERLLRSEVYKLENQTSLFETSHTTLIHNYRSISPILMVPSKLFYNDQLIASAENVHKIQWSGLPNPDIPVVFRGCETEESWVHEGASWYNEGEIEHVVDVVQSLSVERPDILQKEIAVITPWKEQVWRIRARLRNLGFHGIDVGHVEAYQGAEFRVTILSCVRSRQRFLESDHKANMGVYNEPKRFNVAITRAKELLVIIGNANLLKGDRHWDKLLQVMKRNDLYTGPYVEPGFKYECISKIEIAIAEERERSQVQQREIQSRQYRDWYWR